MISNINGNGTSCKYATKLSNAKDLSSVQEVNSTGKSAKEDPQSEKLPHQVNPTVKTDGIVEKKVILQKSECTTTSSSTDAESFLSLIQNSRKVAEAPPLVTKNEKPLSPVDTRSSDN